LLDQVVIGGMRLVTVAVVMIAIIILMVVVVVVVYRGHNLAQNLRVNFGVEMVTNVAGLKDEQGSHKQAQPPAA
jgi:hypothetical protein